MIKNKTKGTTLANNTKICDNFISRGIGLMFKRNFNDCGFVFKFNRDVLGSIHMLFVFFPIDIIWLDSKFKIVELKEKIKPFTPSIIPKHKCRYFIELPAGTIRNGKIAINDIIEIKNK